MLTGYKKLFREKRFDLLLVAAASLFPVYKSFTSVVMLFLFGVTAIVLFYNQPDPHDRKITRLQWTYFFITTGFFQLMIVSMIYTSDLANGWNYLVTGAYMFIYPLVFILFVKEITDEHVYLILFTFAFACCLHALKMHYQFYEAGLYSKVQEIRYNDLPFRDVLSLHKEHPTYLSMWFLFSTLFLIQFMATRKMSFAQWILIAGVIIFLVGSTIILSAKIAIIAFFFSLLVLIYRLVKNKLIVSISFIGVIVLFVLAVINISFLRVRFIDEYNSTELKPPIGLNTNSLNIRVGIYECSKKVFADNWLIGTGIGDSQAELNKCYSSFDTDVYKNLYNSHNNYFDIAIAIGGIGLAAFLFMLTFHILKSIRYNNVTFLMFLAFVMICFIPENILTRNYGVVFFSLFCGLFSKQNLDKQISSERTKG